MNNSFTQAARQTVEQLSDRLTGIVNKQVDLTRPVSPEWSARDAVVHLASVAGLYAEIASGMPSPLDELTPEATRRFNAAAIADIAADDPEAVTTMLAGAAARFLDATQDCPDDHPVVWHADVPLQVAQLAAILASEYLLHGYDIAAAYNIPWPVDPALAGLGLFGRGSVLDRIADPATSSGHTGSYLLNMGPDTRLTVRFTDGVISLDPAGGPADCELVSDPVSMLMLTAGRISQAQLVALGLLRFDGQQPELAVGFLDKLYMF